MFVIASENGIDEGLIPFASGPEPPNHIPVQAQGDLLLGFWKSYGDGVLPTGIGRGCFGIGMAAAHGLFMAHAHIGLILATRPHGLKLRRRIADGIL